MSLPATCPVADVQVGVPQQPGGDRAPRSPAQREFARLRARWYAVEPVSLRDRLVQAQVARWPDVRSTQRHQHVDACGPRTHAWGRIQRRNRGLVSQPCDTREREITADDACREAVHIARFLAREAEVCYATMAHVTDYDVWHVSEAPVTVEMVIQTLNKNTAIAQEAVRILASQLKHARDCECGRALATALITRKDVIPAETRQKLDLLVNKYL